MEIKDYSKELRDIENKKANEKELFFVPLKVSFLTLKLIGLYLYGIIIYNLMMCFFGLSCIPLIYYLIDGKYLNVFLIWQGFYNCGLIFMAALVFIEDDFWFRKIHEDIIFDIKSELNHPIYYTIEEKKDMEVKRKYEKELESIKEKYKKRLAEIKLEKAKKIKNYLLVNSKEYIENECLKIGEKHGIN